jgi:hypothetical protein
MHNLATAEQRSHHVQALPARCLDAVLLAAGCPCTAVGVDLREAGFVEVDQLNGSCLRLIPQRLEFFPTVLEGGVISLFLCCGGCASTPNPLP